MKKIIYFIIFAHIAIADTASDEEIIKNLGFYLNYELVSSDINLEELEELGEADIEQGEENE